MAGRGSGKTRAGSEWIREKVRSGAGRIALIAPTSGDARDVMVEGNSGLMSVCWEKDRDHRGALVGRPVYEPSKRRVTWANGAMATTFSADEPDRLRGPQHDAGWCFIAGTVVATPIGDVPIEMLRPGDTVLTRRGPRPVLANSVRKSVVGRVSFGNGSVLVGTADHPVYLKSGWTRMDRLQVGDTACAIAASNGTASAGIATVKGAGHTMSAPTNPSDQKRLSAFIARFGSSIAALCRTATKSITETTTRQTTTLTTLSACKKALIRACIVPSRLLKGAIGPSSRSVLFGALTVAPPSFGSGLDRTLGVSPATASGLMRIERLPEPARTAEEHSFRGTATTAISVASTWQREAERSVYCLKVAGEPEYFANGILVHNCDELAAWRYGQEAWDMFQFGLRLGQHPQAMVTTTPRPIPLVRQILADAVVTRGSTFDNRANLAPSYLQKILARFEGTRLGRQELYAEILDDVPGALWTRAMIDAAHVRTAPEMSRIVISVDPSGTGGEDDDGDSIGIIAAGKGIDGIAYVLADRTCKLSPDGWGRRAVEAYREFSADRIVAERNFGGAMVQHVIRTVDKSVSYKEVVASRGKIARAEPVAALFEQGKVKLVGKVDDLEDQLCSMTSEGYIGKGSPDRADAMVWAIAELMLDLNAHDPATWIKAFADG